MKKTLIIALIMGLAFTACKNDDSPEPGDTQKNPGPQYTTGQLNLTNGTTKVWKLNGVHLKGITGGGDSVNVNAELQECSKDNRYTYNIDGSFITYTGAEKCSVDEEDEVKGNWGFLPDNKLLWNDDTVNLVALSPASFVVSYETFVIAGSDTIFGLFTNTYIPE